MDSALWLAYLFDIGWFLLLTGALMLAAAGLIVLRGGALNDLKTDSALQNRRKQDTNS